MLVVAVVVASVVCCCAVEMAQADPQLPPCHQQAQHQDEAPSNECECTQILSLAVVPSFDIAKPDFGQFTTIDTYNALYSSVSHQSELPLSAETSLARADSPPLYLKNANLRI
jgi:hypothetical protein